MAPKYNSLSTATTNRTLKTVFGHVGFVILYITNETTAVLNAGTGADFWDFALFFVADILLFYVLALCVLPLVTRGSWITVGGVILVPACWIGFLLLYNFINETLNYIYATRKPIYFSKGQHYWNFYRAIFITILAMLFNVGRTNAEILKQKLRLTNAVLQSQIKPHFLFNNLNAIHHLVDRDPAQAKKAIILLSDLMRSQLATLPTDGLISLQEEINQIKLYLKLSLIQHPEMVINLVIKDIDHINLRLPPSLLLSFVENMYKHGFLSTDEVTAKIKMRSDLNNFYFHTENEIRLDEDRTSFKIGMANARERLKATYKGRFQLIVKEVNDRFILDLTIKV